MDELLGFCSPSLIASLAGVGDGKDVRERAKARIVQEIDALGKPAALLLRWRYGIGSSKASRKQIARRLSITVAEVRRREEEALLVLGFALVCGDPAAVERVAA